MVEIIFILIFILLACIAAGLQFRKCVRMWQARGFLDDILEDTTTEANKGN